MIQQGVGPVRCSYPDPLPIQTHWQNPDPLVKSRPTGSDKKSFTLYHVIYKH